MSHEEEIVVNALCRFMASYGVKCLVQVGADDGYEADAISSRTGCRAVAIEANTNTVAMSPNIDFHHALIGATDTDAASFYIHLNSRDLSSQFPRAEEAQLLATMPMKRLDTFCSEHDIKPDALIIDTEGSTLDVLEGSVGILDGVKVIYAECQTYIIRDGMRTVVEVDRFLSALGFQNREGAPAYGAGCQGNYVWVRKDA